jgi:hypothetical protein
VVFITTLAYKIYRLSPLKLFTMYYGNLHGKIDGFEQYQIVYIYLITQTKYFYDMQRREYIEHGVDI